MIILESCVNTGSFMRYTGCLLGSSLLFVGSAWAVEPQSSTEGERLETLTVEGNRLYDMAPSEDTGGYTTDAATVGTKTPASLRDIPQSISVVTREAMDDQNFNTLDELARRTPGMRVLNNDNGRSSIYARGYEYDEASIDGLPAPMQSINGTVPPLSMFDRVEVMRGPSGLFNSTSEMGGIVNLVRKRPTTDFAGHFMGRAGAHEQHVLEGDIRGALDQEGHVRGRLIANQTQHPEFVDHNDNQQHNVYLALDMDLNASTMLSVAWLHDKKSITVNNGLPVGPEGHLLDLPRSRFVGATWNDFDSQTDDGIVELTHRFAHGGYGRVAARYSDRSADYNYAFGGSALADDGTLSVAGTAGDIDQRALALDASYSQPFEALGQVSEFVVGTDYKHFRTDSFTGRTRGLGTTTLAGIEDIAYVDILHDTAVSVRRANTRETQEELGVYSKLTFRPIEDLALIVGGRLSDYDVKYEERLNGTDDHRDGHQFTGYAGAVYDLNAQHSLYASYAEVFKPQTAQDRHGQLLKPREGEQQEVGLKGSYLDGRLNMRVSAFRLQDHHRAAAPEDTTANYNVSKGKVRIQGGEFELSGNLTPQWAVIAGYTYIDTQVKVASTSRDDGIFMLMPHHSVNLWTQYQFDRGLLEGFEVGAGVTALSDIESSQGVHAGGYAVVDAMLGYAFDEHLSTQLNVRNLFDRDYYARVGGQNTFNMLGEPMTVEATVRYDW